MWPAIADPITSLQLARERQAEAIRHAENRRRAREARLGNRTIAAIRDAGSVPSPRRWGLGRWRLRPALRIGRPNPDGSV